MSSWFMISLAIALAGTYFSLNISEEVSRLMIFIITVICLLLNLVVAPWFIQLLILTLLLLFSSKRFWQQEQ